MPSTTSITREEAQQLILPFVALLNVTSNNLISNAPLSLYETYGAMGGHHRLLYAIDGSLLAGSELPVHHQLVALLRSSQARLGGPILIDVERTTHMGYRVQNVRSAIVILVPHDAQRQACRDHIEGLIAFILRRRRPSPLNRVDRELWLIGAGPQPVTQEYSRTVALEKRGAASPKRVTREEIEKFERRPLNGDFHEPKTPSRNRVTSGSGMSSTRSRVNGSVEEYTAAVKPRQGVEPDDFSDATTEMEQGVVK